MPDSLLKMKAIWTIRPPGVLRAALAGWGVLVICLVAYPLAAQNYGHQYNIVPQTYNPQQVQSGVSAPDGAAGAADANTQETRERQKPAQNQVVRSKQSYKPRTATSQTTGKTPVASQGEAPRKAEPIQPVTGRVQQGGEQRSYTLYVPTTYVKQRAYPMIIVLHGGGGNAEISEQMTRFAPWAASKEFILVHPNGSGRLRNSLLTWNAGNCCAYAFEEKIDDVGFIRSMIDGISAQYHIDPKRIYVAGMSNGAKMAYRLACKLSDHIAAIASVAGSMEEPDCAPDDSVSVIAFHGTADDHVLYEGGTPKASVHPLPRVDNSVAESIGFWANADQCDPLPERTQTGSIKREKYNHCLNGSEVVLYSIEGGGHAWPGGVKPRLLADEPSREINATKEIVNFFLAHPKK